MKKLLHLCLIFIFLAAFNAKAATNGPSYTIGTGNLTVCTDDNGNIDSTKSCPSNFSCNIIQSSMDGSVSGVSSPIGVCTLIGQQYCFNDNDCTGLGSPNCMQHSTVVFPFDANNATGSSGPIGICGTLGTGNAEDNILGDALCKGISVVTGKAGRGLVAVVIIFMGVLFFTGKISWNTVLATGLGAGALFGAPALVGVITGKPFVCTRR